MRDNRPIRVLVVDDSAMARRWIIEALSKDPFIEVVGVAADPYEARDQIPALKPDVITLDLEMPRMDGLSFLKILMVHYPIPVVVVSSLSPEGSALALAALAGGAVEVMGKPTTRTSSTVAAAQLTRHVRAAAMSKRLETKSTHTPNFKRETPVKAESGSIIVIGASTGGVEALSYILPRLPEGLPPILVAQHIPAGFSRSMAKSLNDVCAFPVREAENNEEITGNVCLIAPGDYHLTLTPTHPGHKARLSQSPRVHHCRPAVDILFRSVAETIGHKALGVLLTGMGVDGARGLLSLQASGAHTLAQNEESCVVFGMPQAAIRLGAANQVVPLDDMPKAITRAVSKV
jgi:two-component system, chemotaxis family, protein-glutamate methylesterase/glutaminase